MISVISADQEGPENRTWNFIPLGRFLLSLSLQVRVSTRQQPRALCPLRPVGSPTSLDSPPQAGYISVVFKESWLDNCPAQLLNNHE